MANPQSLVALSKEVMEYTVHAFGNGTLTTNGVQYGTSGVATSTDAWKTVATYDINPMGSTELNERGSWGNAIEIEFNLTVSSIHSSTSATGAVTYAWQARNYADTESTAWVYLMPTSSGHSTAVGSTAAETTYSGYMTVTGVTLNKVPMQVRLLVMSGGGSTNGDSATGAYVRAKNSSYVRVLYRVI